MKLRMPMTSGKALMMATKRSTTPLRLMTRKRELARDTILMAAENLLNEEGRSDFSMRELSAAAGVSFTTPFKHFGSKDGVLCELIFRRLQLIETEFDRRNTGYDLVGRVMLMAEVGVELMLTKASMARAISFGIAADNHGQFTRRASQLWKRALGDNEDLDTRWCGSDTALLSWHMAVVFRGALIMWGTNELSNEQFEATVVSGVALAIAAFSDEATKLKLAEHIAAHKEALMSLDQEIP